MIISVNKYIIKRGVHNYTQILLLRFQGKCKRQIDHIEQPFQHIELYQTYL
jgi:hypothetical protein